MKVAVFGFYNALNYGDDRLQHCLTKLLRRQANTVVFLPHNIKTPLSYINTFDWIIIGGGGLVFEEVGIWENLSKWLKWCTPKIGVVGIGINSLPGKLSTSIIRLIEQSSFFYVRDQESKKRVGNHHKVKVYPDLSWTLPVKSSIADRPYPTNFSTELIGLNLLPIY